MSILKSLFSGSAQPPRQIGSVVVQSGIVKVYDEKRNHLFSVSAGSRPTDGLRGYTSATVSVCYNGIVKTYDAKGKYLYSTTESMKQK